MKKLIDICFIYPFLVNALNVQGLVSIFFSSTLGQIISYSTLLFIFLGITLIIKNKTSYTKTGNLWIPFFFVYFLLSTIASIIHFFPFSILSSLVPVLFCLGYLSYFRFEENIRKFEVITMAVCTIANALLIYFVMINFDYDFYQIGIKIDYGLDRAQGIYGDANNAALVGVLGYVFIAQCFTPKNNIQKILKLTLMGVSIYAMYLTYSTTGFVAFTMAFALLNFKYFTKIRLVILPFILIGFYLILLNMGTLLKGFDLNPRQTSKIENFVNLLKLDFDNVDDSGRDGFVAELMGYVYKSPLIGNGMGFGSLHHGHNTYLYILSDAGVFALILFLVLLFRYIKNSFYIDVKSRFYALAILGSFILFMMSLQKIINQPYLVVIFVYLAYYIDNKRNESNFV